MSMSAPSRLDAVLAGRIEHRDQAHDAAIALGPAPREAGEGDALAGHLVDLPADVLEAADAGRQDGAVAGLPLREVLQHVVAGPLLVLLADEGQQAVRPARAV